MLFKQAQGSVVSIDQDEIWQDCSSRKCAPIYEVGFSISCHTFEMAAMTSFHIYKCYHVVSAHKAYVAAFGSS